MRAVSTCWLNSLRPERHKGLSQASGDGRRPFLRRIDATGGRAVPAPLSCTKDLPDALRRVQPVAAGGADRGDPTPPCPLGNGPLGHLERKRYLARSEEVGLEAWRDRLITEQPGQKGRTINIGRSHP